MFSNRIIFIEGGEYLDCYEEYEFLIKIGYNPILLNHIYENPNQLLALDLLKPEYLYIRSTGVYKEKIKNALIWFDVSKYIPKNVIFYNENTAMIFLGLARKLKEKGTKFWYFYEGEFEEINWI